MICQKCRDSGLKSTVHPGMSYTTFYYDENGLYQGSTDDSNTTTTEYRCSQGHKWQTKYRGGQTKIIFLDDTIPATGQVVDYEFVNTGNYTYTTSYIKPESHDSIATVFRQTPQCSTTYIV